MSETVESTFTVKDVTSGDVWLKDIDRGLTIAVKANDTHYGSEIKDAIQRLSRGDHISAQLESQNKMLTSWAFSDVEITS
jgi:hypothetical protein